jgi:hypothetical protein
VDDAKTKKPADVRQTLRDEDIVTEAPESGARRAAMTRIGLGVLGAVGAVIGLAPATAEAQNCTDRDGGPYGDQPGNGRRCRVYYQQPVYYPPQQAYVPPQQAYPPQPVYYPPPPQAQGCTDSDGGPYGDAAGRGRRCAAPVYYGRPRRSCTDSDSGSYADAAGRGRGC